MSAPDVPGVVIAIDGPAGAGKSTVARAVAERVGLTYLDTGAMYRSVTWAVLDAGVDPSDGERVAEVARGLVLAIDAASVHAGAVDVTEAIRSARVTAAVSVVAAHPAVRSEMVRRQRAWAAALGGGVLEGRDIGTVVFPEARLKVFLTASPSERARRRAAQDGTPVEEVAASIARRDEIDSTRAESPLRAAPGAVVVDTDGRTVEQVVDAVVALLDRPVGERDADSVLVEEES